MYKDTNGICNSVCACMCLQVREEKKEREGGAFRGSISLCRKVMTGEKKVLNRFDSFKNHSDLLGTTNCPLSSIYNMQVSGRYDPSNVNWIINPLRS